MVDNEKVQKWAPRMPRSDDFDALLEWGRRHRPPRCELLNSLQIGDSSQQPTFLI
jgi:hypothetical protein